MNVSDARHEDAVALLTAAKSDITLVVFRENVTANDVPDVEVPVTAPKAPVLVRDSPSRPVFDRRAAGLSPSRTALDSSKVNKKVEKSPVRTTVTLTAAAAPSPARSSGDAPSKVKSTPPRSPAAQSPTSPTQTGPQVQQFNSHSKRTPTTTSSPASKAVVTTTTTTARSSSTNHQDNRTSSNQKSPYPIEVSLLLCEYIYQ